MVDKNFEDSREVVRSYSDVRKEIGEHNRRIKQFSGQYGKHEKARKKHYEIYSLGDSINKEQIQDLMGDIDEKLRDCKKHLDPQVREGVRSSLISLRKEVKTLLSKIETEEERLKRERSSSAGDGGLIK